MELLIVMALFGGIMAALLVSFMVGRASYLQADERVHVQQEARRALDAMSRELREAGRVDHDEDPGTPGAFTNETSRINFQIARSYNAAAPPTGCGGICWGNDTANDGWAHYLFNANRLLRCQSSAVSTATATLVSGCTAPSGRVLANDVSAFGVDYDGSKLVTVRLETRRASSQLPGGSVSTTPPAGTMLRTQVRLRN